VAKLNIGDNPATLDSCQVQSVPLIVGAWPKPALNGELAEFFTMMPHLDRARLAHAGRQLARVDAVPSNTSETRHLEIGLGVAVRQPPLGEPGPPLHVVLGPGGAS
jgi:hypothetical protein